MRKGICAGVAAVLVSAGAVAEDSQRSLDAHEHGHGSLTIAIEGGRVLMELEVPGADIVGFEYAPTTDDQKAKVEAAKAALAEPLTLFVLPAAAGCEVESADVALVSDEHGDEDHDEHADEAGHEEEEHDDHEEHEDEGRHAEFHAEYALACASPEALSSLEVAYFAAFGGAEELEVGVITEATQALYEVGRDDPTIDLPAVQ